MNRTKVVNMATSYFRSSLTRSSVNNVSNEANQQCKSRQVASLVSRMTQTFISDPSTCPSMVKVSNHNSEKHDGRSNDRVCGIELTCAWISEPIFHLIQRPRYSCIPTTSKRLVPKGSSLLPVHFIDSTRINWWVHSPFYRSQSTLPWFSFNDRYRNEKVAELFYRLSFF